MIVTHIFTHPDTWTGGFYELSFDLPPSTVTVTQALAALWRVPQLSGCYMRCDVEPNDQTACNLSDLPPEGHIYGIAILPDGQYCACGSYSADFDEDGIWISLYIPLGTLATIYPIGGYPFGVATPDLEATLRTINDWFGSIAREVYQAVRYSIAVIGFESNFTELRTQVRKGVPKERWDGFIIPSDSTVQWYPPTHYGTQFT